MTMATTTKMPARVAPAIVPGLKPPESVDSVEEVGSRGGPGSNVMLVSPGTESVALGEALGLSASVWDINFMRG